MARKGPLRSRDEVIAVDGLKALQGAFKRAAGEADKELRKELQSLGRPIAESARSRITHKTDRHGDPHLPHLADTIRVSATQAGVSIYSVQPYAAVQDFGGRVGNDAVVKRADVSQYMTGAVRAAAPDIERKLETVLDNIGAEFERD